MNILLNIILRRKSISLTFTISKGKMTHILPTKKLYVCLYILLYCILQPGPTGLCTFSCVTLSSNKSFGKARKNHKRSVQTYIFL